MLNGLISDIASISAIFPLTQISGDIGCDLPNTVQLCDNNLVWCTTAGKIYVLKTTNQYSENNIYELSYPITTELNKVFEGLRKKTLSPTQLRCLFMSVI